MERNTRPRPGSTTAVGLLFGLSGVPALIDQVVWERILALHSGVGAVSVCLIVSAFMAGLGVGNQVGGRLSRRLSPRGALWAFAAAELTVGVFAWFSGPLYHGLPGLDRSWFRGDPWHMGLAHLGVLLPPTLLMGTTLPLLVRALIRDPAAAARRVSVLYGLNVIGAALGAAAAPWLLIPRLGLTGALRFGAGCNALAALGVLLLGRDLAGGPDRPAAPAPAADTPRVSLGLWAALYLVSGFYAVALEVVWFRLIDVGAKATAFTFGSVLAVYLAGMAAGSLAGARLASRWRDPLGTFLACQCGILLYTGLVLVALTRWPAGAWPLDWYVRYWGTYEPLEPGGNDLAATLALYAVLPALLFGVPTFLMGLSFTALQRGVHDESRTSGYKVGVLQSANIAGCVAGALVVGLMLLGRWGTAATLRGMVAAGGLLAALGAARAASTRGDVRPAAGFLVALLAVAALMPHGDALWLRLHGVGTGRALVAEGRAGVAALTHEGGGRWRMSVNGKGQSFLPFGNIHSKLGALPATLHPAPVRVAVVGLGSGDTAWAAACRAETREVLVFETFATERLLLDRLAGEPGLSRLASFLRDPRVAVIEADGRTAVDGSDHRFDLIEADAVRPNGAYSGNLYSQEFFEICLRKLRPGGLMCTWVPTFRTRDTFRRVFPHVLQIDRGVILVGSADPIPLDPDGWRRRLGSAGVAGYLGPEVVAECLASLPSARPLGPEIGAPREVNTDLFPRDEYGIPYR